MSGVFCVYTYAAETWTVKAKDRQQRIENFEMWVLERHAAEIKRTLSGDVSLRILRRFFGRTMRRNKNSILRLLIDGQM